MSRLCHSLPSLLLLVALALLTIVAPVSSAQVDTGSPRLSLAAADPSGPGIVRIEGHDFTPGGDVTVYILAYYQGGMDLLETRSVVASDAIFGPNGSADPARGYAPGGTFTETFRGLCATIPVVRAYDQQRGVWSDWLDIDPGC